MRAFITGVTGFAGSHLADHLQALGETWAGCARHSNSKPWWQPPAADSIWPCDLSDSQAVESIRTRLSAFAPEVIYHLAALSIPGECGAMHPTPLAMATNVDATRHVLELAAQLPRPPRVIVLSSSHVYAMPASSTPLDESAPLAPRNGYGQTKLTAERLAHDAAEQQGLDVVIVRAFNHAGPRQDSRLMLSHWARQMALGDRSKPIEVQTLDAWVDMTDVRDMVRAYRLLAEHGISGAIYNVGSGVARRSGEWFERLALIAGFTAGSVERFAGVKFDPIANIGRLQAVTRWSPTYSVDQTVADTYALWCRHKLG